MAGKAFNVSLVTPQGKVLDSQAISATVPAHDGSMGFLANRGPIVSKLGLGTMSVTFAEGGGQGGTREYLIEDGFLQFVNNRLTVLTTRAFPAETLTEGEAQAELTTLEARKPADPSNKAEVQTLRKDRERARAKVRIARLRAGKGI